MCAVALVVAVGAGVHRVSPAAAQALTPVAFQLNFTAGGYNAGFALALQEGIYKKAGLDVTIIKGQGSGVTAQLVATGKADIAYADALAVMQLIAKGAPMKVGLDDLPVEPERRDGADHVGRSSRSRS